ncbi:MAG TPA: helix-turn-helix domain-containing protein [Planctomycetota bacterium]
MKPSKQKRLAAAGWRVGDAAGFLGLSEAEDLFVEIKLALSDAVRKRRTKLGLTQGELARRMQSSQSRVAKLEAGDRTVSIDLLVHALVALGATRQQLARILSSSARPATSSWNPITRLVM